MAISRAAEVLEVPLRIDPDDASDLAFMVYSLERHLHNGHSKEFESKIRKDIDTLVENLKTDEAKDIAAVLLGRTPKNAASREVAAYYTKWIADTIKRQS